MNITFQGKDLELQGIVAEGDSHYYGSIDCDWLAYCEDEDQYYILGDTTYEERAGRVITDYAFLAKTNLEEV